MTTRDEFAQQIAKIILENGTGQAVIDRVVSELNSLVYSTTRDKLSFEDKKDIADKILRILVKGDFEYKEADNKNYLLLITQVVDQLGGKDSQ